MDNLLNQSKKFSYFCAFKPKIMFHRLVKSIMLSQLKIYIIRCIIGFLIGYGLMLKFPEYGLFWSLISIILVISPEGKDARKLTVERVKSNLIGSIVGLCCHFIHSTNTFMLIIGIIVTSIICHFFKVMNMSRVAIVSFLIVMLQSYTLNESTAPIFRFLTVALGCFIGLAITVTTSAILQNIKNYYGIPSESPKGTKSFDK